MKLDLEARPAVPPLPMTAPVRARGVLFDLDGTLIDSAPDLAAAANRLRADHGMAPLPDDLLRPMVGAGARGMVGVAFGVNPDDPRFPDLRDAFLDHYAQGLLQRTQAFAGVDALLHALEQQGLPWGIVTNKAERFTRPIVEGLGLAARAAVVVCGDTTSRAKPFPDPLLHAAEVLCLPVADLVYVGDDHRDAQAAQAAGMRMLAAAWGYLGKGEPIHAWGADALVEAPDGVLAWLHAAA